MPNYSLVANSVFQPFSYQELLAPVLHQQQVQDQLAEQYDKLSSQADILEAMGANDKNSKAYWNFKNYSDSLRAEADNLYRNGLNSESRLRLSELKRRYNSEIVPIQNAWNKRKEEADFQMKASISNPMLRFTRSAANSGIDYYLDNPEGGYGVINLANIASQAGAAFKNLEKLIRGGIKIEGIDATTNAIILKKGLTPEMINEWLNNPAKNPAMTNIVNLVLATNGLTEDAIRSNPNLMAEATQAAQSGAWNAIGEDKIQIADNKPALYALQDYYKQQEEARDFQYKMQAEAYKNAMQGYSDVPTVTSVGVGMVPTDTYKAENLKVLQTLKAGNNSLKAKYFGKYGQANPMKLYEEVQSGKKKEDVIRKYSKYGVTDILSKEQYEALKDVGYGDGKPFNPKRFSEITNEFNKQVEQRSRYSTNMANYDSFNEKAIPNLLSREYYGKESGTIWEIKKDGKQGDPASIKDLKLRTKDDTKGNVITDVLYDPQYKGKIVILLSDGRMYIADPGIYDSNMANVIADGERNNAPAIDITRKLVQHLNERNKVKGKTDSKIE